MAASHRFSAIVDIRQPPDYNSEAPCEAPPTDESTRKASPPATHRSLSTPQSPLGRLVAAGSDIPERERYESSHTSPERMGSRGQNAQQENWTAFDVDMTDLGPSTDLTSVPPPFGPPTEQGIARPTYTALESRSEPSVQRKRVVSRDDLPPASNVLFLRSQADEQPDSSPGSLHLLRKRSDSFLHKTPPLPFTERRHSVESAGQSSCADSELSHMRPLLSRRAARNGENGMDSKPPTMNDIPQHERTVLNRRMQKVQQVLGEALSEEQVARQIIDVARAPPSHDCVGKGLDVDQRAETGSREERTLPGVRTPRHPDDKSAGTSSTHSRRPSDTLPFNLGKLLRGKPATEEGIRILVEQESFVHSSHNSPNSARSPRFKKRNSYPPAVSPTIPALTVSPMQGWTPNPMSRFSSHCDDEDAATDEDAAEKVVRRRQLRKLHRLLGARVPPELLFPTRNPPPLQSIVSPGDVRDLMLQQASEAEQRPTSRTWAKRLRETLTFDKEERMLDMMPIARGSFLEVERPLDSAEKQQALRKAKKMKYLFGENPPLSTYLSSMSETLTPLETFAIGGPRSSSRHSISDSASLSRDYGSEVATHTYRQALTSLQYLVDNDPSSLCGLIQDLRGDPSVTNQRDMANSLFYEPPSADSPTRSEDPSDAPSAFFNISPLTPEFNKTTFKVLRKRAGKLSWLLGNPIAANIGLQQDSTWTDAALAGLLGDIQTSAEVDAKDGLIGREALAAIRSQAVEIRKRREDGMIGC